MKRSPIKRKTKLSPITKNPRRRKERLMPKEVAEAVIKRSGRRCEVIVLTDEFARIKYTCGNRGDQLHHLKPKGRGGKNIINNILHVCAFHHDKIHQNPKWAESVGLLIK